MIPDAALRRRFSDARAGLVPSIGALGAYGRIGRLRRSIRLVGRGCAPISAANRDALEQCVEQLPGVSHDARRRHVSGLDRCSRPATRPSGPLLRSARSWLSDGAQFHGPGFVRFNFGCPRATLDEGLRRFRHAVLAAQ